jgi:hypothetical protein
MWPPEYRHFLESNALAGKTAEISDGDDLSGVGASIQLFNEADAAAEADELFPGLVVKADGYVPIGGCAVGNGDPYFIRIQDQQPGPVYRIYHDSVHDASYDRGQAIVRVLDSYEKLLMYLEES